jgi:hypothetical protein
MKELTTSEFIQKEIWLTIPYNAYYALFITIPILKELSHGFTIKHPHMI